MKLSFLYGITADRWWRLLRDNGFEVDLPYWPRAALITAFSLQNSLMQQLERLRFGDALAQVEAQPPVFILGHWRGGTTHLHYLLDQDPQLSTPNTYQVCYPSSFLASERLMTRLLAPLVPDKRPQDDMEFGLGVPNEDEIALCPLGLASPYLGFAFPRREAHYMRYLTLEGLTQGERDAWASCLTGFVDKLTLRHGTRVVLKSPAHTARLQWLSPLYPQASWIQIHRHPYEVFQSSLHLYETWYDSFAFLQRPDRSGMNERIIRMYRAMYDAFFAQKELLDPARYTEVRYDDLCRDPLSELERIYGAVGLGAWEPVRPRMEAYLQRVADYSRNRYPPLEPALQARIAEAWAPCFEAWGYEP